MRKLIALIVFGLLCLSPMYALSQNTPLYTLSATEAAEQIKSGKITSEALVRELLERAKKNSDLNAFISLDEAIAIADAKKADLDVKAGKKPGKLHGVPFVIKDNIDVKGFVTTAGTPALAKHYPPGDAKVVAKLRSEGAVIIGKTNLHELAFGVTSNNGYFGAVKNPYNKENFAGGSSGGTAAAVAARLVPVGLGTDTGGSIRIPASLNGLYGYRPSVGRFSTEGVVPMSATKDVTGPMARTMEDIILVDAAVNGYEPSKIKPTPLEGLRIGVPRYSFYEGLDLETARLTADALTKLQAQGVQLVEKDIANIDKLDRDVDFPMSLYECKRDFAAFFDPYGIKIEDVIAKIGSSDVKYSFDHFVLGKQAVTAEAYNEVMTKFRPTMLKAYDDYFKANKVDFIIIPTTIAPAKPIAGSDESVEVNGKKVPTFPTYVKNTSPGSNVGIAGISLPIGLTKDGLPVGIEIDTKSGNDEALLGLALALSKVFGPAPVPKGY